MKKLEPGVEMNWQRALILLLNLKLPNTNKHCRYKIKGFLCQSGWQEDHIRSGHCRTYLSGESSLSGILLFYNGKNKSGAEGDTLYTANSYCAGQALFDAKDPTKLIDRLDKPFYIPESDF